MRKIFIAGAALLSVPAAVVLYQVPPASGSFYPPCLFHALTGLHCPGCGSTRCLHALLHGDLGQAAAYNVLLLLALPFLGWWAIAAVFPARNPPQHASVRIPSWMGYAILAIVVAYWVLRNISHPPFTLLAPHQL
jgi:hypothetical protein